MTNRVAWDCLKRLIRLLEYAAIGTAVLVLYLVVSATEHHVTISATQWSGLLGSIAFVALLLAVIGVFAGAVVRAEVRMWRQVRRLAPAGSLGPGRGAAGRMKAQ